MSQNKIIIGLTGGSGAGKGEVAALLKEFGADIICADTVAHDIMKKSNGLAHRLIVEAFGTNILDENGEICRKALREIVFYDKNKLEQLTMLVNPIIIKQILDMIDASNKQLVVIDAPLLIPSGLNKECDVILGVFAPKQLRIQRICNRDGLSEEEALARLNNQMTDDELRPCVDFEINNEYTLEELRKTVHEIFEDIIDSRK